GPRLRPLEQEVLDEMRDAVLVEALVPRAALHPDADRDRAQGAHRLGDHHQAVLEGFLADVAHAGSMVALPEEATGAGPRYSRPCPSGRCRSRSPGTGAVLPRRCGW